MVVVCKLAPRAELFVSPVRVCHFHFISTEEKGTQGNFGCAARLFEAHAHSVRYVSSFLFIFARMSTKQLSRVYEVFFQHRVHKSRQRNAKGLNQQVHGSDRLLTKRSDSSTTTHKGKSTTARFKDAQSTGVGVRLV